MAIKKQIEQVEEAVKQPEVFVPTETYVFKTTMRDDRIDYVGGTVCDPKHPKLQEFIDAGRVVTKAKYEMIVAMRETSCSITKRALKEQIIKLDSEV